MMRGAQVHIHPQAIAHNLAAWRTWLRAQAHTPTLPRLWAVAKADAYGHGLEGVLDAFAHADGLALSSLDEIHRCRAQGWHRPVLYLGHDGGPHEWVDPALAPLHVLVTTAHQAAQLAALPQAARLHVWLRYAGALGHDGIDPPHYRALFAQLNALRQRGGLAGLGHLQHYARAEEPEALAQERAAFRALIDGLPGPVCSENSSAVLMQAAHAARTDWLRCGIVLYGINPLDRPLPAGLDLRPAMSLYAPIVAIRRLAPGDTLGYGGLFRATQPMRVGLVRCGYADGYPRPIPSGSPCLLAGRPSRVLGRISMEVLSIDLSEHPQASIGDAVLLWGAPDLRAETVASAAGTNAASLCTGLTARVARIYPGHPAYRAPAA